MALFRYLMRSSRRVFLLAIAASVVSGGTGAAFIAMVNLALHRGGSTPAAVVWAYVTLCVTTVVTRFLAQSLLFRLSQGIIQRLRRTLVDGILAAPLRSVEQTGTPRLYSALSDDVVVIGDALPGLPLICSSAAFVLVCFGYLTILSPVIALAAVLTTVVGVVVYRLFAVHGLRLLGMARAEQDRLFEHFRRVTGGIKEFKLNRQRRLALAGRELDATATAYRRYSVTGLLAFEGAAGSGQAVFFALIGVLLFAFPHTFPVPAATLAASVLVVLFAVASLQGALIWLPLLGRASVALATIEDRLAFLRGAGREDQSGSVTGFGAWQRIQLCGVSHVYPGPAGEQFTLGPLDLEVRRGEVLFVVGGNGSGKTTLAKVLTSLYPPESGEIRVDGTVVTGHQREAYRQLFSAVFADFFLFDNLLGLPGGDRAAKARHYLRRLQLDHLVTIAGDHFSTTALSQGQRKRLALLAAYLEDRSCYVFDEWAADQDPVFKEFFYAELLAELRAGNRAVVVISHDDRYFPVADRLIRLDYGQIRQEVSGGSTVAGRPGAEPLR
jgi:putative pyoverdin transport system ATP-binding/permease protein